MEKINISRSSEWSSSDVIYAKHLMESGKSINFTPLVKRKCRNDSVSSSTSISDSDLAAKRNRSLLSGEEHRDYFESNSSSELTNIDNINIKSFSEPSNLVSKRPGGQTEQTLRERCFSTSIFNKQHQKGEQSKVKYRNNQSKETSSSNNLFVNCEDMTDSRPSTRQSNSDNGPDNNDNVSSINESAQTIILSISWTHGKLGAAFYNVETGQMHIMEDKLDAAPEFWILTSLMQEINPRVVVMGGRQDDRLYSVIKKLCNGQDTPISNVHANSSKSNIPQSERRNESPFDDGLCFGNPSSIASTLNSNGPCKISILPAADFKYENCRRRVLTMKVPGMDNDATDVERETWLKTFIDVSNIAVTRALGGLIRFTNQRGGNMFPMTNDMTCLGLQSYTVNDLVYMNMATSISLQVFCEDHHPAAVKTGKVSASKEGLSLYALLNRTSSSMASALLRRMLLQPTRDVDILQTRYDTIAWAMNPRNCDVVLQMKNCLKSITNVQHIVSRLQAGQLSMRDWRILYKSLFNSILIGELCQAQDDQILIFNQITDSLTEGLYHATFLIQRVIDFDQSERESRFVVKPGVDQELDHKKRRFNGLGVLMKQVAELELEDLPETIDSCCMTYMPHIGYLLSVPCQRDAMYSTATSTSLDTSESLIHPQLPGLRFIFQTNDMALYKSRKCCELDEEIGDIQVEIANHETRIMMRLIEDIISQTQYFLTLINHILMLDVLLSLSIVSKEQGWVQPTLIDSPVIEIDSGRHPLYELCTPTFVCNSTRSGGAHSRVTLITGPNGSGKTVYIKQLGVIAFLTHIGCWVPAKHVKMQPLDAIITVTQATPAITSNISSFMLELTKMTTAVNISTPRSLILIDEFGASTYENDGAALLTACIDYWTDMLVKAQENNVMDSRSDIHDTTEIASNVNDYDSPDIGDLDDTELFSENDKTDATFQTNEQNSSKEKIDKNKKENTKSEQQPHPSRTIPSMKSFVLETHEGRARNSGSKKISGDLSALNDLSKIRSPHVFVSTHFLSIYDHLNHQDKVKCLCLKTVEENGAVIALYEVAEDRSHKSHARNVAIQAGVHETVIKRAVEIEKCLLKSTLPSLWKEIVTGPEMDMCNAVVNSLLAHDCSKGSVEPLLSSIRHIASHQK